jgi:hypothetical protein
MRPIIRWGVIAILAVTLLATAGPVVATIAAEARPPELIDLIPAVIPLAIAVFVVPMLWRVTAPPAGTARAFRDASLGIGTLVEARRTGLTVNDQPQLDLVFDVEGADGVAFRGTAREILDLTVLSQLVPGVTIPVRYLPGDASGRIVLAPDAAEEEVQDVLYDRQLRAGRITPQQVHVARNGFATTAVVMGMRPTGELSDGLAVIRLDLRVTRPDGTAFDAVRELPLAQAALPGVQPGSVVAARYLPEDEGYVAIEVRVA